MDDQHADRSARLVADSVFSMLDSTGWGRARTRWVLAELPGRSATDLGIEGFRTYEDDLGGLDVDSGLVGRRAGPEVLGMAVAGEILPAQASGSEVLRTVLAVDRSGRWFRVAASPGRPLLRTSLAWFDGPGSAMRCYLGAPWHGPAPPSPHEVCTRWWLGSLLGARPGDDAAAGLEAFARSLDSLAAPELTDGWVPRVPVGWGWDELREVWAVRAERRGDGPLAELVRWADAPELAARIRQATPVVDPDWLAGFARRSASAPVLGMLRDLGLVEDVA